jgi:hypothetical protein
MEQKDAKNAKTGRQKPLNLCYLCELLFNSPGFRTRRYAEEEADVCVPRRPDGREDSVGHVAEVDDLVLNGVVTWIIGRTVQVL